MFAGPNGSGKSTITEQFRALPGFPSNYINPDVLTRELAGDGSTYLDRSRRAQQIAVERRQQAIASKTPFGFETVMSHPSKVAILHQAKRAGYNINLVFVCTTNPAINVARVASRVRAGGHDVPSDKIVARYYRSLKLLPSAVEIADQAIVFDNTENYSKRVSFENGQLVEKDDNSPAWIERIASEVSHRQQEKRRLIAQARERGLTLQPANINSGTYSGRITRVSNHYAIQRVSNASRVLHDLSLVKAQPGRSLHINYSRGVTKTQLQNEKDSGMEI